MNFLGLFLFTLFYYQLNNLLQPLLYNKFDLCKEEPIVFYPVIYSTNVFILYIFIALNANLIIFSKIKKGSLCTLSLIYFTHLNIYTREDFKPMNIYTLEDFNPHSG